MEAEEGNWVGVGIRCGRGVVCLLAGSKAAVDLPQGHTCLVRRWLLMFSPLGWDRFFLMS